MIASQMEVMPVTFLVAGFFVLDRRMANEEANAKLKVLERAFKSVFGGNDAVQPSPFKAVSSGSVGGMLVTFDTRDLEGEFFRESTDYGIKSGSVVPILFHHELYPEIESLPIGHAKLNITANGVMIDEEESSLWVGDKFDTRTFVNDILGMRREYLDMLQIVGWERTKQVAAAVLSLAKSSEGMGWSSGAYPDTVERAGDNITKWHIKEASITWSPAEPSNDVKVAECIGGVCRIIKSIRADADVAGDSPPIEITQPETVVTPEIVETESTENHMSDEKTVVNETDANAAATVETTPTPAVNAETKEAAKQPEAVEPVADFAKALEAAFAPIMEQITALRDETNAKFADMDSKIDGIKTVRESVAEKTTDALSPSQFAAFVAQAARSVVGNPEAAVDGRTAYGKNAPEQKEETDTNVTKHGTPRP